MYILTKRALGSNGRTYHLIHGATDDPESARAWFRASAVTDVVEVPDRAAGLSQAKPWRAIYAPNIAAERIEGWRDQWTAEQLLIESLNASAKQKAKRP